MAQQYGMKVQPRENFRYIMERNPGYKPKPKKKKGIVQRYWKTAAAAGLGAYSANRIMRRRVAKAKSRATTSKVAKEVAALRKMGQAGGGARTEKLRQLRQKVAKKKAAAPKKTATAQAPRMSRLRKFGIRHATGINRLTRILGAFR